mmetsp:Transcript_2197/g.2376  ORF Transcript_2197/g.2376 Transcript_2197/m.2376 type:complete len:177 (+) Transcript_2197:38-568(+)
MNMAIDLAYMHSLFHSHDLTTSIVGIFVGLIVIRVFFANAVLPVSTKSENFERIKNEEAAEDSMSWPEQTTNTINPSSNCLKNENESPSSPHSNCVKNEDHSTPSSLSTQSDVPVSPTLSATKMPFSPTPRKIRPVKTPQRTRLAANIGSVSTPDGRRSARIADRSGTRLSRKASR